jgi:hypothetical protein
MSILARTQQDEGAGFHWKDAMILCKLLQLRVFGAGVKNNAAGTEGEDIIVVFLLGSGVQVECYCIYGREVLFFRVYVYVGHFDLFFTDGDYRVALATQAIHSQVTVTLRIVGGA